MGDVLTYVTGRQQLFYRLKCNLSYSWCFTREELDDLSRSPTDEAEKLFHCHDFLTPTHTFLTITTLFTCPVLMYIRVNSRLPIHHRGNSPTPIHLHLSNIKSSCTMRNPTKKSRSAAALAVLRAHPWKTSSAIYALGTFATAGYFATQLLHVPLSPAHTPPSVPKTTPQMLYW